MDRLYIVVSSYNNAALLPDCLRSVAAAHPGIPTTVYVVDAGSTDGTADGVRRDFPAVRLIVTPENRGYAALNNLALREIVAVVPDGTDRTRVAVLLLNADTAMPPDALTGLLGVLAAHPEAGGVGPKIVLRDGSLDLACRRSFPTPLNSFWKLTGMAARYPRTPRFAQYNLTYHDPDEPIEMDSGMGACLMVRLAAIDAAGLMDERFFMYGEDLDWCYRIKGHGWRVRYEPRVRILHYKGSSSSQRSIRATLAFYGAMWRFHRMHYARQTALPLNLLIYTGIGARGLIALLANILRPARKRRVASAPSSRQ
ncbi:MAG: glycosyltransferase [Chloroflexota bacterium]|nr:glycosyltransferase [Chloroflexota bacterium]